MSAGHKKALTAAWSMRLRDRPREHGPHELAVVQPVFHPCIGDADRKFLLQHPDVLVQAGDPDPSMSAPEVEDSSDNREIFGLLTILTSYMGLVGLLGGLLRGRLGGGLTVLPVCVEFLGFGTATVVLSFQFSLLVSLVGGRSAHNRRARAAESAARLRKYYVLPGDDLDECDRTLLGRARAAVETVARSQVYARGTAGGAAQDAVLPNLVWDLARELAEQTRQRRLVDRLAPEAGPVTKAALAPRAGALDLAATALADRVTALEAHARQVVGLDAAHRDLAKARGLAAQDPTLDLLSRRTRDAFAAEDLARLSEPTAARREQAAREASELTAAARQLTDLVAQAQPRDLPPTAENAGT